MEVAVLTLGFVGERTIARTNPPPPPPLDEGEDDDEEEEVEDDEDDDFDESEYLELLPSLTASRLGRIPDVGRRREAIQMAVLAILRSNKMRIDHKLNPVSEDDDEDETALKLLPDRIAGQIRAIPDIERKRAAIENAIKSILRGHKARIEREARKA